MFAFPSRLVDRLDDRTIALFRNADFRRLYGGHATSKIGDELYFVAAMWLVYELSGSTLLTGLTGFLARVPGVVGFLFGPVVDRSPLRRLLTGVELLQGVVILAVPVAAALGVLNVWVVIVIVPLIAGLKRLSDPAQNAAIPRIVADEHLVRANSLASTGDRAIGAVAQAAAGALIAVVGAVSLFLVNAATFLASAVLFALTAIPATEQSGSAPSPKEYVDDVVEGFSLVTRSVVVHLVVGAALAGAFTGMATAVLPAFAAGIGGAGTYGLLMASMTVGTLVGALLAARLESVPLGRVTTVGFALSACCWLAAVTVDPLSLTVVLFGLAFVTVGSYNVLISASLQSGVPETILGRVTATAGSLVAVIAPAGLLVGGVLGDRIGSDLVIGASAVGFALIAAYWAVVPSLRGFSAVDEIGPGSFGSP